eukprot:307062-Amphidinium_carterae.1
MEASAPLPRLPTFLRPLGASSTVEITCHAYKGLSSQSHSELRGNVPKRLIQTKPLTKYVANLSPNTCLRIAFSSQSDSRTGHLDPGCCRWYQWRRPKNSTRMHYEDNHKNDK